MDTYITGTVIKRLRENKNLTQSDLAEMIGVSSKTVSKWETGKGLPDISLIEPLSTAFGRFQGNIHTSTSTRSAQNQGSETCRRCRMLCVRCEMRGCRLTFCSRWSIVSV